MLPMLVNRHRLHKLQQWGGPLCAADGCGAEEGAPPKRTAIESVWVDSLFFIVVVIVESSPKVCSVPCAMGTPCCDEEAPAPPMPPLILCTPFLAATVTRRTPSASTCSVISRRGLSGFDETVVYCAGSRM